MVKAAEQRVFDRLRSALPADYRLYPNVRWISKRDASAPARDGETDLLIVHPENGLLVVETKGGRIRRDGLGRWWSGEFELKPPPFEQAENSKHALAANLTSLPDWPGRPADLRSGHAVASPDIGAHTAATRSVGLGPDTDLDLVLDQADLASDESARGAVDRAYDFWLGDRRRGSELSGRQLELIDQLLAPTVELAPMLRPEVERGEQELVRLIPAQIAVLDVLRSRRRASIIGPAGSGKTMLAREKARRLAREGFSTLLVCFNQPLARMLADDLASEPAPGGLLVSTFHELCLTLGREAGTLPPEPADKTQEWWDEVLPRALDDALSVVGGRYHAIVVDEGQDFARDWLDSLYLMLTDPDHDVLYVSHDPEQSLYRDDVVHMNCRNTGPIHRLAARYAKGLESASVLREVGREPELVPAAPGRETLEALRKVLHRLTVDEGLAPWQIADRHRAWRVADDTRSPTADGSLNLAIRKIDFGAIRF